MSTFREQNIQKSKVKAAQWFLDGIEHGEFDYVIIWNDARFFECIGVESVDSDDGDKIVYSYGGHVNSDCNDDIDDILRRF